MVPKFSLKRVFFFFKKKELPLGIEFMCTKSPKIYFKIKTYKTLLDDSRYLKIREKNSGVTFEEKEGKDFDLRHPFNLTND